MTNEQGNFFIPATSEALSAPAHAAIRDATRMRTMTNVISDGDCNGCHRVGGQEPIHLK
jgi:hypothetical protein